MNTDWTFSQSKLLAKASFDVRLGICLSLSYEWCKSCLAGQTATEMQMARSFPSMSQQRAFTDFKARGKTTEEWITMLAKGDGLQSAKVANGDWAGGSYAGCANAIDHLTSGTYIFVATGTTTAHAMGLTLGAKGTRFFDSNTGQYSVPAGKVGADIEAHMTATYQGAVSFSPGYWRFLKLTGVPRMR